MVFAKKLFNSTILGLTLGVLLAGYAVFAFQGPTQAPPGGNVAAPINVGPDPQVKSGGLWVGSLGVDGGVTVGGGLSVGKTPTEPNDVITKAYLENSLTTGLADSDNDGAVNIVDCAPNDNTKWRNRYADGDADTYGVFAATCVGSQIGYVDNNIDCNDANANIFQNIASLGKDADQGGYYTGSLGTQCVGTSSAISTRTYYKDASASFTWVSSASALGGGDCYDANANARPGQTSYFTSHRGDGSFDYDCSGSVSYSGGPGGWTITGTMGSCPTGGLRWGAGRMGSPNCSYDMREIIGQGYGCGNCRAALAPSDCGQARTLTVISSDGVASREDGEGGCSQTVPAPVCAHSISTYTVTCR